MTQHFNPGQLDPHDPLRAVVSGRSAVLFVVLAGVSVALSTGTAYGRTPRPGARAGVLARAAALTALGQAFDVIRWAVAAPLRGRRRR